MYDDLMDTIEEQKSMLQYAHQNFLKISNEVKKLKGDING